MKSLGALLFAISLAGSGVAAEVAPAPSQHDGEPPALPEPPPPPRTLPRTVWPNIELGDGRRLEAARALNADALSVTFAHSDGITKVDRRLLPEELATVFPFDPAEAARLARVQAAERIASAEEQRRVAAEKRHEPRRVSASDESISSVQTSAAAPPSAETLRAVVRTRAKRHFENEKRTGSGATLVFSLATELEDPEPVSGWPYRWEIEGIASYKVYDSLGWGSFSARTQKFRALVEAPPGKTPKVVSFDER
jgi:hypothetical protein